MKTTVAIFCAACIGAELIALLTHHTRMRSCIKAVAGLYIVVSLFRAVPQWTISAQSFTDADAASVDLDAWGTWEDAVLQNTANQLEQTLQTTLKEQCGISAQLQIELTQNDGIVEPVSAQVTTAQALSQTQQEKAVALLQETLGLQTVAFYAEEEVS
jgi:hypothetical protein